MNDIVQFLLRHSYPMLFAAVFASQLATGVSGEVRSTSDHSI
jgi:hypothetical protein